MDIANRGADEARFVATLLEQAAEEAEHHEAASELPGEEQQIWERSGAKFKDSGAIARVRARKAAAFADLVDRSIRGDAALAKLLGVDRTRISQRVSERSIYAFEGGGDERCFPRWQFIDKKPLRGLRKVLPALDSGLHPLTVDHWFRTPNVDLVIDGDPVSPVDWLATGGDPQAVVELVPEV